MLNFRLVNGPMERPANEAILREYNRLTGARIPINEFEHWVQNAPAGPAWHALLETDDGRIVGHTSVFPFRTGYGDPHLIPAKSEFSVVLEDCRGEKIRGFEKVSRPAFIIILDQLFRHCLSLGWGPIFASTNEKNQVFTRRVGLRPVEFPLRECILTLKPKDAAQQTPNIDSRQRAALFAVGLGQQIGWSVARFFQPVSKDVRSVPMDSNSISPDRVRLSFFEDPSSLSWRYLEGQYVRFALESNSANFLIAKRGSGDRYLRVCQWRLSSAKEAREFVLAMIRLARQDAALGVRWAIYDNDPLSSQLLPVLKKLGFLCAHRVRIVMVHQKHPDFLSPAMWNMNDSLFSFDP
jgi:hypothetical protein